VKSTSYINNNLRKLLAIGGALIILAFPLYVYLFSFEDITTAQSFCPFKMSTGLPCPGCGITKSFAFIYDGNLTKSFYYHIFGPFAFAFCIGIIIMLSLELITKKEFFRSYFYSVKIAYLVGITLSIYHIARLFIFLKENDLDDILNETIWL
jgi:hypothetical protein